MEGFGGGAKTDNEIRGSKLSLSGREGRGGMNPRGEEDEVSASACEVSGPGLGHVPSNMCTYFPLLAHKRLFISESYYWYF